MKKGDWVIHDYKIKQIMEMTDGKVREVSDGWFRCSSLDLTDDVRPLTLKNKCIAESIQADYSRLKQVQQSNALNWPDIHRHFSALCLKAIDDTETKEGQVNQFLQESSDFVRRIRDSLSDIPAIDGIRLFR